MIESERDIPSKHITLIFGVIVPNLPVPIDPTHIISIQHEVFALDHKSEGLILEPKGDSILDPELDVGGERQPSVEV